MSLSAVSNETLSNFNNQILKLVTLLETEFPTTNEVKVLKAKVNMGLSASKRSLYDLFCAHVKPEYTMKIMYGDVSFIEDAKKEYKNDEDAATFLPVIVMLWEKGGKVTTSPVLLQKKVIHFLKAICLATLPPSVAATMSSSYINSSNNGNRASGGKLTKTTIKTVKPSTSPYTKGTPSKTKSDSVSR